MAIIITAADDAQCEKKYTDREKEREILIKV